MLGHVQLIMFVGQTTGSKVGPDGYFALVLVPIEHIHHIDPPLFTLF